MKLWPLLLLACVISPAQENPAFEFKGARLGMGLSDFRAQNRHPITLKVRNAKKKLVEETVDAPICTDQYQTESLEPGPLGTFVPAGVVACTIDATSGTDVGGRPSYVVYKFLAERLYKIEIKTLPLNFSYVVAAFRKKYGEPTSTKAEEFQNGFGAKWYGAVFIWDQRPYVIQASEGPAQRLTDFSMIAIYDARAAAAIMTPRPKVDF